MKSSSADLLHPSTTRTRSSHHHLAQDLAFSSQLSDLRQLAIASTSQLFHHREFSLTLRPPPMRVQVIESSTQPHPTKKKLGSQSSTGLQRHLPPDSFEVNFK
uniref:Uncharacterized protein n=1 Tax=Kalanchoe fedtschenkoi TaxID=63787 RepID=A0A7N0UP40_KALFE